MNLVKSIPTKWLVLIAASIGMFMSTLDASIVNITYPRLTEVFKTEPSTILWVSVVYLLVSVGLMLAMGKIGDSLGRKRVYIIGFTVFTIGLVFCSLSQNIIHLILARAVQAVGAAMMLALSTAIVTAAFTDEERGKALGMLAAVVSAGLLTGPVVGGYLLDLFDWRAVFYVRIPIGIIGIITAKLFLKEHKEPSNGFRFDIRGTLTLFGGLSCLLIFFNLSGKLGFLSPLVLTLGSIALVLLLLFIVVEKKATYPIIDLNLFKNRIFASSNISLGMMTFANSAFIFLMPFYLINGIGHSASTAGLIMAVISLTTLLVGPMSGWLSDKIGSWPLCTFGIALVCLALFLLRGLSLETNNTQIVLRLLVLGIGIGTFGSPNTSAIMGSVPKANLSTGSAMISTTRQIGLSSGIAIFGTIFTRRQVYYSNLLTSDTIDPISIGELSLVGSFQDTMFIAAIVCSIGFIASLVLSKR